MSSDKDVSQLWSCMTLIGFLLELAGDGQGGGGKCIALIQ